MRSLPVCQENYVKLGDFDTSEAPTDLRRRHGREVVERITSRAQWLPRADRELILAVFNDGKRTKDLAALMSVSPRVLRSRVRRLVRRVTSEQFQFAALHHETWPAGMKRAAEACIFAGLSIKDAARELGLTYHGVRRHVDLIRVMARTNGLTSMKFGTADRSSARAASNRGQGLYEL
ncbi:MAG: hypothetical protein AB7G11_05000 [Phycisphaerales bacterium]